METEIAGLATNTAFLIDVLGHPAFLREEIDTGFIERHRADLLPEGAGTSDRALALAAAFLVLSGGARAAEAARRGGDPHSPWATTSGWRLNGEGGSSILLRDNAGRQRDARMTFSRRALDHRDRRRRALALDARPGSTMARWSPAPTTAACA